MSIKNMYCNKSQNFIESTNNFCLRFLHLGLILFLAPRYLGRYYIVYPVKQTGFVYLKFHLKPVFFSLFLLFLERYTGLCLF